MKTTDSMKREWLLWLIILSPLVLIFAKWDQFGDRIPIHWNVNGEVDNYGGKWALFLSPVINAAVYFMMVFLPKIDPRKQNYDMFSGTYFIIRTFLTVFLCFIGFITILASLGVKMDVGMFVMLGVIALFMILGNQFGKIRPNYFVGLRTPWTLNNEEVWMRTHRFAGKLWVITSLLLLIALFFVPTKIFVIILISALVVMTVVPMVYSYRVFKEIGKK